MLSQENNATGLVKTSLKGAVGDPAIDVQSCEL